MKRYSMVILVTILSVTSVLLAGCGNSERDKAITFYRSLNPMFSDLMNSMGEWKEWNKSASETEYWRDVSRKSAYYEAKMRSLYDAIAVVEAPQGLRPFKDALSSAINKGAESFMLNQRYAITGDMSDFRKARQAQSDYDKLMTNAISEWDRGLTRYRIDLAEIVGQ